MGESQRKRRDKRCKRKNRVKASVTLTPNTPVAVVRRTMMKLIAKHLGHRCPADRQLVHNMAKAMLFAASDQAWDEKRVLTQHFCAAACDIVLVMLAILEQHPDNGTGSDELCDLLSVNDDNFNAEDESDHADEDSEC